MKSAIFESRILNRYERFTEIVFGLIMVLSFTCAISVAEAGRDDIREMFIAALGCNIAWGIIDAVFYLFGCLAESGRSRLIAQKISESSNADENYALLANSLPAPVAATLTREDFARICAQLKLNPLPPPARLTAENWKGALGVFLLVFLVTLPVVFPFLLTEHTQLALRISNGIAIALLYGAGSMLAQHIGARRWFLGLAMVGIGVILVGITIALGG